MAIENHTKSDRPDQDNLDLVTANVRHLNTSSQTFAESLLRQYDQRHGLTEKQWFWMDILAKRCIDNAAEYGRRTGKCMYCRRKLSDERSVTVGYGPICADRNHLPWGEV